MDTGHKKMLILSRRGHCALSTAHFPGLSLWGYKQLHKEVSFLTIIHLQITDQFLSDFLSQSVMEAL